MKKKLIIDLRENIYTDGQIWTTTQVVEQVGKFKYNCDSVDFHRIMRGLEINSTDNLIIRSFFMSISSITGWLNQFADAQASEGKLAEGSFCMVRAKFKQDWYKRKLIVVLPETQKYRYICEDKLDNRLHVAYVEAKPVDTKCTFEDKEISNTKFFKHHIITIGE